MEKIVMNNPIVEMDGDEMTRILWAMIKKELLEPYIELNTEYYDLGLPYRDETEDRVTVEAGEAIRRLRVGVKCATITPNDQRVEEYKLKKMWNSPNATIRAILDGTVFRAPIILDCIKPAVRSWKKPIVIARHAYGDIYKALEFEVHGPGRAELLFTGKDGAERRETVYEFDCPGVLMAMHNHEKSVRSFAHACFRFALDQKQDLWFGAKDTILKTYDQYFKNTFTEIFESEYATAFKDAGIEYFYTLIDDACARVVRSEGGFIWACKNYDGDVMSDLVSTAFGSLALMTSVLVSPDGCFFYEAAHGTVTRHYYRYLEGGEATANPIATIFAWTGALRKSGEMDGNGRLTQFADALEAACLGAMESGTITNDLKSLCEITEPNVVNTADFLAAIKNNLDKAVI
ncbi:MAG: NADP-dependent isocitrate dehydrogenase [Oscillospiraceae bacterium]|nr:NADP-dependent isocitrate dehydrogenase [Oscillospiraceae bacterium]